MTNSSGPPVAVRHSDQTFVRANQQLSLFEQVRLRRPDLPERDAIVLLCERLLAEAEAKPPIPVERVASLRGIVRVDERDQPWAGILEPHNGSFVVGVRSSDSHERQRFSVCHEAGHTLFPGFSERAQFRCTGAKTGLEQRCDTVATELLLPRKFFLDDIAETTFGLDIVERLAGRYEASIEATALRFADLWPEKTLVLVLHERHKPSEHGREAQSEAKLRLDYGVRSGDWPFLRRHKSVAPDSVFARALAGELVSEQASLGELAAADPGPVEVHARRYGSSGRIIALVRPAPTRPGERRPSRATTTR